ncbi:MAG: type II toxin-antitoxin system HicB family antitoxin [Longimicrobiaceae bacterium]
MNRPSRTRTREYKGYVGRYEADRDDGVLHGRVDGIRDIVTFVADNLEDLEREFRASVDIYLEFCAERGVEPNRPTSLISDGA